jgi:hypothetical protein
VTTLRIGSIRPPDRIHSCSAHISECEIRGDTIRVLTRAIKKHGMISKVRGLAWLSRDRLLFDMGVAADCPSSMIGCRSK